MAAEGNKKGEKEPYLSRTAEEEEEQHQKQQQAGGQLQRRPPSSPSSPSSHLPLSPPKSSAEEAALQTEPPPSSSEPKGSISVAKSPAHGDGGVRVVSGSIPGQEETEVASSSIKTTSAPATPSGVSWLAEKAIVLVRFAEYFRRGHVIRYDAELNMCVVQLEFSNTVVNKGIEDIFPDDPTVIAATAEALKKKEEQERSLLAGSSRPSGIGVPCPSSAPPFIFSAPTRQIPELHSSTVVCSPDPSNRPPPITKADERQPSPPLPHTSHPLTHPPPTGPQVLGPLTAPLSLPISRYSIFSSGITSASNTSPTSFQEALRLLYQQHTTPPPPSLPEPSLPPSQPPVTVPLFQSSSSHHLLIGGHRKRHSTDEVETGPSQDDFMAAAAAAVAAAVASSSSPTSTSMHPFPRRQSESGLYKLAERFQRYPSGEQITLKRVRSEYQSVPFSMLGQLPLSRPPLSFTMVIGDQAPAADPEQLARNLLLPLLNPPQSFGAVSTAAPGPSSSAVTATDPITAPAPRRTSALDLLLMTEGEARQFSESMLAGSSLASNFSVHPHRPSNLPTGLTPALRSFTASTPASGAQQVFNFSGASSATTSDVVITPSSSSSAVAYRAAPSSAGPSSSTGAGPSASDYHAGFRRSEAAKCRRVYGAVNKNRWCKQCRWKKACTRFQGPSPHQKDPPDLT